MGSVPSTDNLHNRLFLQASQLKAYLEVFQGTLDKRYARSGIADDKGWQSATFYSGRAISG